MELNKIYNENCLTGLKKLPDSCIDCCVTSPPYFGLRDYGIDEQIGLEETPQKYVEKLVEVFEEVRRVLKPEGTLWLNLGDSYWGGKGLNGNTKARTTAEDRGAIQSKGTPLQSFRALDGKHDSIKPKDLVGIPWMVAFALRDAGWYLRQDIIWHKPNPMPESVTDRCTKSHEYIFLFSKSQKYYYDHREIMKDVAISTLTDSRTYDDEYSAPRLDNNYPGSKSKGNGLLKNKSWNGSSFDTGKTGEMKSTRGGRKSGNKERKAASERGCPENTGSNVCSSVPWEGMKANKRSVWTIATKPFKEAHFATFPEDLIVDCIKAGSPWGGGNS